ncbi:MAG: carbohydrate kinase family protein [Spirochaetales bacterium]|nr:carbohydrate kinase family protein [Spirochaetales bacterium]
MKDSDKTGGGRISIPPLHAIGNLVLDAFFAPETDGGTDTRLELPSGPVHVPAEEFDTWWNELPREHTVMRAGGAPGNVARALAALDTPCIVHGIVGRDCAGERYRELLSEAGVILASDSQPGVATGRSVTHYRPRRVDDARLRIQPPPPLSLTFWEQFLSAVETAPGTGSAPGVVYIDGYLIGTALHRVRDHGEERQGRMHHMEPQDIVTAAAHLRELGFALAFDLAHWAIAAAAPDTVLAAIHTVLGGAPGSVVFAKPEELEPLGGLQAVLTQRLRGGETYRGVLVLKEGALGCSVFAPRLGDGADGPFEPVSYRGVPTDTVEATGRGDCFAAGWLASALRGRPLYECAAAAYRAGALCSGVPGAMLAS